MEDVKNLREKDHQMHVHNKSRCQNKVQEFELPEIKDEQVEALERFKADMIVLFNT